MKRLLVLANTLLLAACQQVRPLQPVSEFELQRFMGEWYVIAHIPTWPERNATQAIEHYSLAEDGSVDTVFTFIPEGESELKRMTATGFPDAASNNAVWGMQFLWPIKADYRVAYIDDDYSLTIVARNKRDYLWIMAREPHIAQSTLEDLIRRSEELGYDMSRLRMIPHTSQEDN